MSNSQENPKEILVCKLYAGSYLNEADNIGHEVINQYNNKDGKYYIYIPPYGEIPNYKNVDYVVFVRNIGSNKMLEVVSYAKLGSKESFCDVEYKIGEKTEPLSELFKYNSDDPSKLVVYETTEYKIPKKPIVLTADGSSSSSADDNVAYIKIRTDGKSIVHRIRQYYKNNEDDKKYYDNLKSLIDEKSCWQDTKDHYLPTAKENRKENERVSFLKLTHKENDELIFSNLFSSFLSKDNYALKKFLSVVLGVKAESGGYLSVKREYKHTDLYISNSEYDVVIENKIKFGINGIKQKQEDNEGCDEEESQLTHYIDAIAPERDGGKRKNKKAYFFLVAPDYNLRTITPLVEKYGKKREHQFRVIGYSKFKEFFENERNLFEEYAGEDVYNDFLEGLSLHSFRSMAEFNEYMMIEKLKVRVRRHLD